MHKKNIQNWGNFPKVDSEVLETSSYSEIKDLINNKNKFIARGNGRCYGDSSLQRTIVSTLSLNKLLSFDTKNGILKVESGVLLSEILEVIVPQGFFLPVTPGTKWITIGGAVASNIHGKNHHKEGSISNYIESFEIITDSGDLKNCSKVENVTLFYQSLGGMGLTGIITTVTIKLKSIETSFIKQTSIKAKNLDEIINFFEEYNHYTYSVAWIDCLKKGKNLGRSILMLGEHATKNDLNRKQINFLAPHSKKQIKIPFYFPNYTLNKFTVSLFNELFYYKQLVKEKQSIVHYNKFFYPLDMLNNWNRIYGKNGFTQYQFVIPFEKGREGLTKIMKVIAESGCGSFLAVLKTFGKKDDFTSPLSFPKEGYTLALDFKISSKVFSLLDRLDKLVLEYNGRLYLTKDVRMSKEMFEKTYNYTRYSNKFISLQFERLCDS
jgi:decaprenylphospho-beta-D-ribofuranose 2-oxidase